MQHHPVPPSGSLHWASFSMPVQKA